MLQQYNVRNFSLTPELKVLKIVHGNKSYFIRLKLFACPQQKRIELLNKQSVQHDITSGYCVVVLCT